MLTQVELRHMSAGRLRLRLRGPNGGRDSLRQVVEGLEGNPKVSRVSFNPMTRTILVLHEGGGQDLLAYGERQKLFSIAKPRPAPPRLGARGAKPSQRLVAALSRGIDSLDEGVLSSSGGKLDLPSVALTTLLGAAVWRARGGALLPSAISLVSIAFGMVGLKRHR
jgi:hypothetical protein